VVHPAVFGDESKKNELTKTFIEFCFSARTKGHCLAASLLAQHRSSPELLGLNIPSVLREFQCAAYNCLVAVTLCTQKKEKLFEGFLLKADRCKQQQLWELLFDCERTSFGFDVKTAF